MWLIKCSKYCIFRAKPVCPCTYPVLKPEYLGKGALFDNMFFPDSSQELYQHEAKDCNSGCPRLDKRGRKQGKSENPTIKDEFVIFAKAMAG
jgi:hypothetical protein